MRSLTLLTGALVAALASGCGEESVVAPTPEPAWAPAPYTRYVDPLIGTGGRGFAYASAVPGALAPFGMVRLSPDTTGPVGGVPFHHYSGYHIEDEIILGFSHLHFHGTGEAGYGDLLVMPVPGFTPDKITPARYRSHFDKTTEIATPGYYSARLDNGAILAELSTTGRAGVHRYTFPHGASGAALIIDGGARIPVGPAPDLQMSIDADSRTVRGHHRIDAGLNDGGGGSDLYWVIAFDRPLKGYGTWRGPDVSANAIALDSASQGGGVYLEFDLPDGGVVNLRVGLSMVDSAGAANNLAAEAPDFDFDAVKTKTESRWESMLSRVKIVENDPGELAKFYTAAYHALVMPTIISDADGRYPGFDHQIHRADGFEYYTDLSLWDTFRTLHPWLTLVYPEVQTDIIISLLKMYEQDGFLPIWPVIGGDSATLIGASAELVIADSYVKGLRDYDTEEAYEAVTRSAREASPSGSTSPGRRFIDDYLALGYVPHEDARDGTSMTLEYAASDGAVSQFAAASGHNEDAAEFAARAGNYRNHWDPQTTFFRAKQRDGSFHTPFDPNDWDDDYREATAWQYLWYVPHDPQGLIELFGGREPFVAALESFFEKSREEQENLEPLTAALWRTYYWAGNEPDIHTANLFTDAGRPDLAARWNRWQLETLFTDQPNGLPGNDDCGTLSTWYLFTTLGFYPIPGYDKYYVGAPRFTDALIERAQGNLRISAPNAKLDSAAPESAQLNDLPLPELTFRHSDLRSGATLRVEIELPALAAAE